MGSVCELCGKHPSFGSKISRLGKKASRPRPLPAPAVAGAGASLRAQRDDPAAPCRGESPIFVRCCVTRSDPGRFLPDLRLAREVLELPDSPRVLGASDGPSHREEVLQGEVRHGEWACLGPDLAAKEGRDVK